MNQLILLVPPILIALTFHEYAHAWVAFRLGDPTAKMAGRLSLNPLSHLDPIGTIMLFVVHFGWAKPVPIDPRYFKDPKRDMLWVALAGPGANMALAFLSGILLNALVRSGSIQGLGGAPFVNMLVFSLQINLALAVFNLLPIPPLDGSKIVRGLLPNRYEAMAWRLEQYGPWILMGIIFLGFATGYSIFWMFIGPFVHFFSSLFSFGLL
ncbi:MAG: site-2 protease family protein [Candidatus Neomarinimicrobiota bacterium]